MTPTTQADQTDVRADAHYTPTITAARVWLAQLCDVIYMNFQRHKVSPCEVIVEGIVSYPNRSRLQRQNSGGRASGFRVLSLPPHI